MLVLRDRFLLFEGWQIWWPNSPEDVFPLLSRSPVVSVMQCGDEVASALGPHAFRSKPFYTSLIDLSLSENELWSRLDARSCRQPIRRARDIGCSISVNEDREQAFDLINRFIHLRPYRRPISTRAWRRDLEHGDVFTAKHEGRILAAHLVLVDRPLRARLLLGATARLEGGVQRTLMGGVNRYLHWFEFNYYKAESIPYYDLGGVDLNQKSPLYPITRFKLSFGGETVRQNILRLAANRGLRVALRELARVKQLGETIKRLSQRVALSTPAEAPTEA